MKASLFYRGLKVWCTVGLNFFYRQWQINNVETVKNVKGPVIFIPTHQNAFLDAILLICSQQRNPWSIARASVFKKGLASKLLTAVQIKPVFRMRDGFSTLKNNEAIIQEWIKMLSQGNDIAIFAEGNHNPPYTHGELQRGFARMALKFQQQYENIPLSIIPVAIFYDDHLAFRSRVLVNFGEAIDVNSIEHKGVSEREKLDTIVAITEESMGRLSLQIENDQYEDKYAFLLKHREYHRDMLEQLESDRAILRSFPHPPKEQSSGFPPWIKRLNPLVWVGWLLHVIPYAVINQFIRKNIKDPQFIASLKYALGIFLVPLYYLILLSICFAITGSFIATLIAALTLPISGIIAADVLK